MKMPSFRKAAFSLVEVALALGVSSFCLTAVFGLLPVGLNSNLAASNQTDANGILTAVSADLRATPGTSATSQLFSIQIPANPLSHAPAVQTLYFSDGRQFSTSIQPQSQYMLTVTFQPNQSNGTSAKAATLLTLQVSWPAAATLSNAAGSVRTFVAIDRN